MSENREAIQEIIDSNDATAHMTLGQIKARDIDNLKLLLQHSCREHDFVKVEAALQFMGQTVDKILLRKFGIDQRKMYDDFRANSANIKAALNKPIDRFHVNVPVKDPALKKLTDKIDKLMAEKDVKVERRQYHVNVSRDGWRSGIYIYHQNEIAYFISEPYRRRGGKYASPHIIVPEIGHKWHILTNWVE